MQLQQHSLQTQITGGQRHLQAEKVRPTKLGWMKWQKAVWRTVATEGLPTSWVPWVPRDSFSHVTRLIYTCDMTYSSPGEQQISGSKLSFNFLFFKFKSVY